MQCRGAINSLLGIIVNESQSSMIFDFTTYLLTICKPCSVYLTHVIWTNLTNHAHEYAATTHFAPGPKAPEPSSSCQSRLQQPVNCGDAFNFNRNIRTHNTTLIKHTLIKHIVKRHHIYNHSSPLSTCMLVLLYLINTYRCYRSKTKPEWFEGIFCFAPRTWMQHTSRSINTAFQ